jgi:hypothetical protein
MSFTLYYYPRRVYHPCVVVHFTSKLKYILWVPRIRPRKIIIRLLHSGYLRYFRHPNPRTRTCPSLPLLPILGLEYHPSLSPHSIRWRRHFEDSMPLRVLLAVVASELSYSALSRRMARQGALQLPRNQAEAQLRTFFFFSERAARCGLDAVFAASVDPTRRSLCRGMRHTAGCCQTARGEVDPGLRLGSPTSQLRTVKSVRRRGQEASESSDLRHHYF